MHNWVNGDFSYKKSLWDKKIPLKMRKDKFKINVCNNKSEREEESVNIRKNKNVDI